MPTKPDTDTGWRVVLPNARAYDAAGTGDHSLFSREHCCVCGRPAKGDNWLLLARATDGTQEFAISNTVGLSDEERRSVWIAPIGPDCLKRHPELRFALIATTSDFEQLIRLRKAAEAALIALDMATFSELDATGERAKRLLREALAHAGGES